MKIPLLDLKAQYEAIREEILAAVNDVFDSQHFIMGRHVRDLETRVAQYCGCRHAIGVASGTDALLLALKALGLGPSDAVATSAFTFFATGGAVCNVGATPVFVDIDRQTFNLDPEKLDELLAGRSAIKAHRRLAQDGSRLRAVLPVHLYGQMAPMSRIMQAAREHELAVLEDAAQAVGATQEWGAGKGSVTHSVAGTVGNAGTLSFFPSKNLGGAGDGGMILTNDDAIDEQLRILRVHGSKPKYVHHVVGFNSRLDELQAAVLGAKLPYLERWSDQRARNADHYRQAFAAQDLQEFCQLPVVGEGNRHIYHQFVVRVQDRELLRKYLLERGVGTEVYYPIPLHLQSCFRFLGYQEGDLPVTEAACREVLALPIYPELSSEQMDFVVGSMVSFYRG